MPNSPPGPASSRLPPTAPSSTARATVRPTSSAVSPYPASRSAVTGTFTAATMRRTCSSIVSRSIAPPSGTPQDQAMPALVVAMAGKPTCSRMRADPASQALGSTKPGPACGERRAVALWVMPLMMRPPAGPRWGGSACLTLSGVHEATSLSEKNLGKPCRNAGRPFEETSNGPHQAARSAKETPMTETLPTQAPATTACTPEVRITRSLLGYGVVAGPFYITVSLAQALVRGGFDLSRHEWSLLANGPGGWVQVLNLVLTGLMVVAAAIGFRRALGQGRAARWAPRLLAVYGVALVAAGVFRADPMNGFPVGTPDGPPVQPTPHGTLHFVAGGIGFLALVAATWLLAGRFRHDGRRRQAALTRATGIALLVAFAGIASGATSPVVNLAFTAAVVLTWAWLSLTSLQQYRATV